MMQQSDGSMFERLCQEYMMGQGNNREQIEEEIVKIVSNTSTIEELLQLLTRTTDLTCTLFIGLELLTKTYLNSSKVGSNNSRE